jgi:hypothetical protein
MDAIDDGEDVANVGDTWDRRMGRGGLGGECVNVGKLVAAHGYSQKRENRLEIKK